MNPRKLFIRGVRPEDAVELEPRLTDSDRADIRAAADGWEPIEALRRTIEVSDPVHTVTDATGRVLAIFGVSQHPDADGSVWLLGASELVETP